MICTNPSVADGNRAQGLRLRLCYWREAWESLGDDPVRITFDTKLEYCLISSKGLFESRPDWRRTPLDGEVILEVKFTDHKPHWVDQMLRRYQLVKLSVAKYAESIDEIKRTGMLTKRRTGLWVSTVHAI
ncbi:MAG: hypothetical protein ACI841_001645 [Planctomycetota bacterium]|jgi:hypothetical protein